MKTQYLRGLLAMLTYLLLADTLTFGQATIIDNGVPNNKWILHNPEDSRKTLFIAPWYNGTWDFNQQTQFRPNGDVNFSGKIAIGTSGNTPATSRLEVYGDFKTTTGRFSSIYSQNTDGAYPANVVNALGEAQLSIGANWTSGMTDLSLINSNIANTTGGGFSFWQMTGATSKRALAYLNGSGQMAIGMTEPINYAQLHVHGAGGIISTGTGSQIRIRDQQSTRTSEPWLDEWAWYATGNVARFHRPGLGDVMAFSNTGNVGIGTINPGTYRLAVEGLIGAREVEVKTGAWADFVFADDYHLPSLESVEAHISANKHLPGIPSEAQVKREGYALGAMDAKLLQKIEELTLYIINQQKQIDELRSLVGKKVRVRTD